MVVMNESDQLSSKSEDDIKMLQNDRVNCIHLAQNMVLWWAFKKMVMWTELLKISFTAK
jgi:hypothetical protein